MREFPASPISALIDGSPQYDLGESYAPHLSVADIVDPAELAGLSLGYGTSAGDAELRARANYAVQSQGAADPGGTFTH